MTCTIREMSASGAKLRLHGYGHLRHNPIMQTLWHKTRTGETIACDKLDGNGPAILWLGGFRSDRTGSKASYLADLCAREQWSFLRFDYFGHGDSSGEFVDGSISQWVADALEVLDAHTRGKVILVGSSMGGWMALKTALARPDRIAGLVLLAPAPDFTEDLMWAQFPDAVRRQIEHEGVWEQETEYGPLPITRKLIEDGRENCLLDGPIAIAAPVRIIQGKQDADVPWRHAARLLDLLQGEEVHFSLLQTADHGLSRPQDLRILHDELRMIRAQVQETRS